MVLNKELKIIIIYIVILKALLVEITIYLS